MKTNETLLQLLNKEFGFPDARAATYKKIKQYYDEKKAQHVIFLELRISRGDKTEEQYSNKNQSLRLLHQLMKMKKA